MPVRPPFDSPPAGREAIAAVPLMAPLLNGLPLSCPGCGNEWSPDGVGDHPSCTSGRAPGVQNPYEDPDSLAAGTTTVMIVNGAERFRGLLGARLAEDQRLTVVAEAASGLEALALLDQAKPDVVVVDHGMPRMSGLDLAREILRRRPSQLIVMLAGELDEERRRLADEAGVRACLTKFETGDLPALIARLMTQSA